MSESPVRDHMLSSELYDRLKRLAQIGLPAAGTLYFALSQIWGFPHGEQIVGTIVALDAFLGILLGYSSISYDKSNAKYDGAIEIETSKHGPKTYSLVLNTSPEVLDDKSQVVFKVNSE